MGRGFSVKIMCVYLIWGGWRTEGVHQDGNGWDGIGWDSGALSGYGWEAGGSFSFSD